MPVNQAATVVARSFGFDFGLCGTVVITGLDPVKAGPASLSPAQAGAIFAKIRVPSAWRRPCPGGGAALTRGVGVSGASLSEVAQASLGA